MGKYSYTKQIAAGSQIETAIFLYFHSMDPASIHTLIHAAWQILKDLLKKEKASSSFNEIFLSRIKDKYKTGVIDKVNKNRNWLKHSDKKEEHKDSQTNISTNINEINILFACFDYSKLTKILSEPMKAYILWMIIHKPEMFEKEYLEKIDIDDILAYKDNKKKFFDELTPLYNYFRENWLHD